MSEREQERCVGKTPLHQIRNRNEARVAQIMPSLFGELNPELGRSISRTFSRWRSISCRRTTSRDGYGARGTGR